MEACEVKLLYFLPRYDAAAIANGTHTEVIAVWRAHGVETEIVTLTAGLRHPTTETLDGITVHRLPVSAGLPLKLANRALSTLLHYPYFAGALVHYRRLLQRHSYDMVHIETAFPLGLVAALLPRRSSPPLAVTLPGADIMAEPEFDYGYGRFKSVRTLLPLVFRRAHVLRACSRQLQTLAVRLGASPDKIVAIPYNITNDSYPPAGTDLAQFRAAARMAIAARYQLDASKPIVVSLSRLHPFKGVDYLVEALAELSYVGMEAQALIIGPSRVTPRFGDYGAYLQQRAADLDMAQQVRFAGQVERAEIREYLAAADAVVVPSVAESFNRVAVEAAAVGTPVVVTRTTGVSDYASEHGCGLAVEPRSSSAIAAALAQLFTDHGLWAEMSARGPAMAAQFSSEAIGMDLLRLYQERLLI
ncbi:MAG TPA: glycosyltransferase family 4 protein [Roseiflexaceae bacterium]|nr:glycosyltransferase family 4 protein [Roseiflexaceae bacterium]